MIHYYVWDPDHRGGKPPHEDCRETKDKAFWIIRSEEKLNGLVELGYYVVRDYMKIGY